MAGWEVLTLQQAGVVLIDCVHATPPAAEVGYPYIGIPQMKDGRLNFDDARKITKADFAKWTAKAKPQQHDVVLSRRTNPGVVAPVRDDQPFALGQNLVLLRADGKLVLPAFLRWLVAGPHWWEQISKFINVGAVFDSLRCADVPKFELPIPPFPDQEAITELLTALDDKIELNRRTNETLEAQARALFRDWFVDFGPVKAKMAGDAPYLAPELCSLFPGRLNDEGVPEGWTVGRVRDVLELAYGKSLPARLRRTGDVPVYGSGGINGFHDSALIQGPTAIVGRKGTVGSLFWESGPSFPIDTVYYVKPSSSLHFCYELLTYFPLQTMNTDAAVPGLNRENVYRLEFPLPPDALVDAYEKVARTLRNKIVANEHESRSLAQIRDLLLPKLMSGELRVGEAAKELEGV